MTPVSSAAPPARRRWRFLMIVIGVLVVVGAAFVGFLAYRDYVNDRLLRDAIAEVEATDPHWRVEALEAQRTPVPDEENSVNIVRQACALVQPSARWTPRWVDLSPEIRLTDQQYQRAAALLAANPGAIEVALTLTQYPRGGSRITFAPDVISTLPPHLGDAAAVCDYVLRPLLFVRIHEGNGPGALQACRAVLNLGRSLGDEPLPVSQLSRIHYHSEAGRGLERILGHGEVSDAELAALQSTLAEEAEYDPWETVLHGHRAMAFEALAAVRRGRLKPSRLRTPPATGLRSVPAFSGVTVWLDDHFVPDTRPASAEVLRYFSRLLETANRPWPERRAAVNRLALDLDNAPELGIRFFKMVSWLADAFQSDHALGRCAVVMIALERYRLRHGAWPPTLTALVPEWLPAVPTDPFDGQPLQYRQLEDGVVVYSIGVNLVDDGGRLHDINNPTLGTDVGFRLWDAPHRRQLPPEIPR